LKCDFSDETNWKCTKQSRMLLNGYVLVEGSFGLYWKKPSKILPHEEIILDKIPDFIHVHCTGNCIEVFKKFYPEEYKMTCKYYGVSE
jgi:hypothetical protein